MTAQPHPPAVGPLAGVRIVDMTTVIMGPYATSILADYGADVVKIEPPTGDVMRYGSAMRNPGMGAIFLQINRNKRSVVLDVKKDEGRRALLRLCESADVFVHNVRPAGMRRARLGEDDVRGVNPRLVYVSLVGYGQNGPDAPLPAYDDLFQGRVGVASLIGSVGGGDPRYVPVTIVDRIVGLNAVHTVLAALVHRDRTGEGQAVELAMMEAMSQFVLGDHSGGRTFEPPIGPIGYSRLLAPDRRPYRTKDGWICTLIYTDKQWRSFYHALGKSDAEFDADPRLQSNATRARHFPAIYAMVGEILEERTTAEWMRLLSENDIPCGPLNDIDGVLDDPHLAAAGFFHDMDHPTEGKLRLSGIPSRWSATQPAITRHPPNLGEHTAEVLAEAGFSAAEIEALVAKGAARLWSADRAVG